MPAPMKRKSAPLPESPPLTDDGGFERIEKICNDKIESFENICSQFEQNVLDRLSRLEKVCKEMKDRVNDIEQKVEGSTKRIKDSEAKLDKTADTMYQRWDKFEREFDEAMRSKQQTPKSDPTTTIDVANSLSQIASKMQSVLDHVKVLGPQMTEMETATKEKMKQHTTELIETNKKNFGRLGTWMDENLEQKKSKSSHSSRR